MERLWDALGSSTVRRKGGAAVNKSDKQVPLLTAQPLLKLWQENIIPKHSLLECRQKRLEPPVQK
jgi:hypothetical protein